MLARLGLAREDRIAMIMLDTVDFPVLFWGAIRAGIIPIPLNTLLPVEQFRYILAELARQGAVRLGAVPESSRDRGRGACDAERPDRRRRRRNARREIRRAARRRDAGRARRNLRRRGRVLALLVRLDGHAEGRAARAHEPARHREALRAAAARHQRERRMLLGRQALSRLRPRQRHELSDVGRRDDRAAAGSPDAGRDLRGAAGASSRRCFSARRRSTP